MAVAGTDNECLYADISAKDRCSDEGIWSNSKLEDWKKKTEENILQIPGPKMLMNTSTTKPLFLSMDGFALR